MWRERHELNIDVAAQHDKTWDAEKSRDQILSLQRQGLELALTRLQAAIAGLHCSMTKKVALAG